MATRQTLMIKDPQDINAVAIALLKSGYTVTTTKRKIGNKYINYIVAQLGGEGVENDNDHPGGV